MRSINIGLVIFTFITGTVAAVYWYRSSQISIRPTWSIEPGEHQLSQSGWVTGTLQAFSESAVLNAKAAIWTAVSVVLGTLSSVAGVFLKP
jgi:hypothetical protein